MKRIYFFDVDNTIRSNKEQKIFPQTLKLLEHLSKNPDYILGFATGRGPAKMIAPLTKTLYLKKDFSQWCNHLRK